MNSSFEVRTNKTVVVLGRQRIDSHISVDLDVKKLGLKSGNATYGIRACLVTDASACGRDRRIEEDAI